MKKISFSILFFLSGVCIFTAPLYSPSWGFSVDPPEGYEYAEGDNKSRFSFVSGRGANFDIVVYPDAFDSVESLAAGTVSRLGNQGDMSFFEYRGKKACLIALKFNENQNKNAAPAREGWAFAIELDSNGKKAPPLLLALAYGPSGRKDLELFHLSCIDSIAPSQADTKASGPITDFSYPRGPPRKTRLAGLGVEALIAEHDAEGAQALVDREFAILGNYLRSPGWQEAWKRFYRAIYRDSWERLINAAFELERYWNVPPPGETLSAARGGRNFAEAALRWVQNFTYERNLMGSDFVNLVSAAVEGRGDCDSRAMLWAIIMAQANIPSAIMVSKEYSHAMGLADLPGKGARFTWEGTQWLVAETTAPVSIGLIGENVSEISAWLGITFE